MMCKACAIDADWSFTKKTEVSSSLRAGNLRVCRYLLFIYVSMFGLFLFGSTFIALEH
jgi:hypothetical protein